MAKRDEPRAILLAALAATAFLLGASPLAARADDVEAPADGAWVAAARASLPDEVPAVGNLRARRTTRLGAQVSGRVLEVHVDVGDVVARGDPIVSLDGALFEIARDRRKADLDAARVAETDALVQWTRMRNLWEKPSGDEPSIPKKLYDDARARLDASQSAVRQAEQALRYVARELEETVIRAPWDGVVSHRFVDPGEPVTSQPVKELVELMETAVLEVEFSLPQELLSRVGPGARVTLAVAGAPSATGPAIVTTVAVIYPSLDEATRAFRCRAYVANADGRLRPGLLARVRVEAGRRPETLVIPEAAVISTAGGSRVTVRVGGRPVARDVSLGARGGGRVEVVSGVAAGEEVLVSAGPGGGR